jgi:hypothetical protein
VAKQWIMVRMQRDTHAALCLVRDSLRLADELDLVELDKDDRDRVSLDEVIRKLIEMRRRHAERRRRSNARRKRSQRAAKQQQNRSSSPFPPEA